MFARIVVPFTLVVGLGAHAAAAAPSSSRSSSHPVKAPSPPVATAPALALAPLPSALPPRCQALAVVPPSARAPGPQLAVHISVGRCLAAESMSALELAGDETAVSDLDHAAAAGLAILDDVIGKGDPYWQLLAQDAKRDLYRGMIVRARVAVVGDAAAHAAIAPLVAPWQQEMARAIAAMAAIDKAHPDFANRDPVVAHAFAHGADATATAPTTG